MEFGYVVLLHVKIYFRAYFPLNVTIFHVLWNSYSPPPTSLPLLFFLTKEPLKIVAIFFHVRKDDWNFFTGSIFVIFIWYPC